MPVGALFHLWASWPALTGVCPVCGGRAHGYTFTGFLSLGGATGVCLDCARALRRLIGGMPRLLASIRPLLADTPFQVRQILFGGSVPGPRRPLVEALAALGVRDLPGEEWIAREGGAQIGLRLRGGRPVSWKVDAE